MDFREREDPLIVRGPDINPQIRGSIENGTSQYFQGRDAAQIVAAIRYASWPCPWSLGRLAAGVAI